MQEPRPELLVIGPSGIGKTVLLGSLQHAALVRDAGDGRRVRVLPRTEETRALFRRHAETIDEGRPLFTGTNALTEYLFDVEDAASFWPLERVVWPFGARRRFSFLDGPGGSIFRKGEAVEGRDPYRTTLIERARSAKGLMLCVDGSNAEQAALLFKDLPDFLGRLGDLLPYRRVVICLTKADRVFASEGRDAERAALEDDPRPRAARLMTRAALNALAQSGRRARVGVCWVSAYGFIPGEGSANYCPHTDGLLTKARAGQGVTEGINAWRPFQVLDPLRWLATGRLGAVRLLEESRLAGAALLECAS